MNGLKIYKISKNNYELTKDSKLFSFMWNPFKYKIYNFKKLGGINDKYIQKGTLLKKPHIQMILQLQNKINENINENIKKIKSFNEFCVNEDLSKKYLLGTLIGLAMMFGIRNININDTKEVSNLIKRAAQVGDVNIEPEYIEITLRGSTYKVDKNKGDIVFPYGSNVDLGKRKANKLYNEIIYNKINK